MTERIGLAPIAESAEDADFRSAVVRAAAAAWRKRVRENVRPCVCFEGPDGAGKSTLLRCTSEHLKFYGVPTWTAAFPTDLGREEVEAVLSTEFTDVVDQQKALFRTFLADQARAAVFDAEPCMVGSTSGGASFCYNPLVLQDRGPLTTLLYQGLCGLPRSFMVDEAARTHVRMPALVVIVNADVDVLDARLSERGDADSLVDKTFEASALQRHLRAVFRESYLPSRHLSRTRIVHVNTSRVAGEDIVKDTLLPHIRAMWPTIDAQISRDCASRHAP